MPEEKTGIRLKIFMAGVLIFLIVIFGAYIYNILSQNKNYIRQETKLSTECLYIDFSILEAKKVGNNALITLKNERTSSSNIETVNLKQGDAISTEESTIIPSTQKQITFENVTGEEAYIYPNNCKDYAKKATII